MSSRTDYRDLVRAQPDLFANPPGAAFEILLDEDEIQQVEAHMAGLLAASDGSPEWARVGVAFRDQYLLLLRDAVRSRDGSLGTYIRFVPRQPGRLGVVTLPIWQGRVLLIRHFRHATRSWHLEIPRGFGISTDTEESALRASTITASAPPRAGARRASGPSTAPDGGRLERHPVLPIRLPAPAPARRAPPAPGRSRRSRARLPAGRHLPALPPRRPRDVRDRRADGSRPGVTAVTAGQGSNLIFCVLAAAVIGGISLDGSRGAIPTRPSIPG